MEKAYKNKEKWSEIWITKIVCLSVVDGSYIIGKYVINSRCWGLRDPNDGNDAWHYERSANFTTSKYQF